MCSGRTCVALRIEEGRETDSARLMVVVYPGTHRCAYRPAGFDGFGGGGESRTGCVPNAAVWFLMESSELHDWSRSEREEEGGVGCGVLKHPACSDCQTAGNVLLLPT
ncbi:hypothetical protein EBH_0078000 [Eimeria brunetti]|uniref:Uncharacterized protein n=1 Tax=Eimeria brunetti TaxID=51314 RepID=U6LI85_9EIME|nr:hypothetical protein EBH_0078000 [Eimeria brunetti]